MTYVPIGKIRPQPSNPGLLGLEHLDRTSQELTELVCSSEDHTVQLSSHILLELLDNILLIHSQTIEIFEDPCGPI